MTKIGDPIPKKIILVLDPEKHEYLYPEGQRTLKEIEIQIKDPLTLTDTLIGYAKRLQENGHDGIHCFYIDDRWLMPDYRDRAREYFLHPQLELCRFMDAPVYFIDEINCGQYDVAGSAMGWVGALAVPV